MYTVLAFQFGKSVEYNLYLHSKETWTSPENWVWLGLMFAKEVTSENFEKKSIVKTKHSWKNTATLWYPYFAVIISKKNGSHLKKIQLFSNR